MMRLLVQRVSKAQIAELRAHLKAEREAIALNHVAERTRLLAHFHSLLARMTGNQVLEELQSDLLSRSSLISLMYQSSQSAAESSAEHEAIVDALEHGEVDVAVQLAQSHIEQVERNLRLDPRAPDLAEALKEHI